METTTSDLYLDLLKRTLTRALFAKPIERHTWQARMPGKRHLIALVQGSLALAHLEVVRRVACNVEDYVESSHAAKNRAEDAETMLGTRQLDQMRAAITDVVENGIPGDLIECGVWRGGMTIFARGVLAAMHVRDRTVWVADSFEGLPSLGAQERAAWWWRAGDMGASLETVRGNFARYGLLDEQVRFLCGFFSDSLPTAPIRHLAILRIDADLYQSTLDVLTHLYPKLSLGGYCIIDDYRNLQDCQRAVDEYRHVNGIAEPIVPIDARAVYWQRRA